MTVLGPLSKDLKYAIDTWHHVQADAETADGWELATSEVERLVKLIPIPKGGDRQ